ncbi:MAG TPA: hypothetical protein EYN66_15920 [Myxococcales bacterium]|nr:hypothetical protein [Myxococcales bacterium]
MEDAKNDATIEHVFVVTHIGFYSSKPGRNGSGQMRALLDQFKSNKVKVVMSGHDHYFEHGISGNGLHYIITGGGGAPLYETKPELSLLYPHEVLVSDSIHNYLVVTVAGNWVEVIAKDLDGKVLDSFEIGTAPTCIEAKDCKDEKAGTCPGSWTCTVSYQCLWSCKAAQSCNQGSECKEAQPTGTCKGDWTCINSACQWDCAQTGECSTDTDCKDKKPLIKCDNSYFKCDANVCEFYCPTGGGSTSGNGTGNTGATGEQPSGDSAGGTANDSPGSSSSGCHHGPFHSGSGALWMFCLLLAAMVVRRRWI